MIGENEKQWVSASIIVNEETFEVEMRLKGDWTDHLNSGKDSYRIKLKGEELFMGMHSFSIQHPKTRNYMHAFWMHQLLEKEKLLTTKYDFIPVSVNGINKGVFAIEAHFEKELLTRMNRPQGPILKMDESGLWEHTLRKKIDPNLQKYPAFEASVILPFKKNKTLKNKQSKIDFIAGAKLVNLYKSLYEKPTEIFEIDQIAKYYALLELGNVQHGHQWHNKRFYYNPKSKKIENIGFDLNAGSQANETLYIIMKLQSNKGPMQWQLILPLLKNTDFKNCYLKYLTQFSEKQYLESSFNNLQTELKEKEQLLGLEIENYSFDKEYYFARAEKIRKQLTIIDSIWTVFIGNDNAINGFVKLHEYQFETDSILLKDISINTYVDQIAKNEYSVVFENYHLNEVEIIGYETVKGQVVYFDMEIIMPSYFKGAKIETRILKNQPKKIYFRSQNTGNKVFKKEVYNWSNPNG